jgi:hypothetical protein
MTTQVLLPHVSLGFDDESREADSIKDPHKPRTDQVTGDGQSGSGIKIAR